MSDPNTSLEQMRADWNTRARDDANYYVAFGRRDRDEDGFLATGREVGGTLRWALQRRPKHANRECNCLRSKARERNTCGLRGENRFRLQRALPPPSPG